MSGSAGTTIKAACGHNKSCISCPVFKLISVQLSALFNLTGTAQPLTWQQNMQHSNSTLQHFVITSALPPELLHSQPCPSFPSFLFTFSWRTPTFVTSLLFVFSLFLTLRPIRPFLYIYIKGSSVGLQRPVPRIKIQVSISTRLGKAEPPSLMHKHTTGWQLFKLYQLVVISQWKKTITHQWRYFLSSAHRSWLVFVSRARVKLPNEKENNQDKVWDNL